jgi:hypothetical protein
MHRQILRNPSPFRMPRPLYKTPLNSSLISLCLLLKPSTGCRKIARRSSTRLRASPHRFGAYGEPHASFSPPTFFSRTGAFPWSPLFILSAAEQHDRPTSKAHCHPADLQPPLPLTSGSNQHRRSNKRDPLVELSAVVTSSSSKHRQNTTEAHHLHASPVNLDGTLATMVSTPLLNLVRQIFIVRLREIT